MMSAGFPSPPRHATCNRINAGVHRPFCYQLRRIGHRGRWILRLRRSPRRRNTVQQSAWIDHLAEPDPDLKPDPDADPEPGFGAQRPAADHPAAVHHPTALPRAMELDDGRPDV